MVGTQNRKNKQTRKNFFATRAANQWNKIPAKLKAATSKESFKQQYKKYRRIALDSAPNQ